MPTSELPASRGDEEISNENETKRENRAPRGHQPRRVLGIQGEVGCRSVHQTTGDMNGGPPPPQAPINTPSPSWSRTASKQLASREPRTTVRAHRTAKHKNKTKQLKPKEQQRLSVSTSGGYHHRTLEVIVFEPRNNERTEALKGNVARMAASQANRCIVDIIVHLRKKGL